MARHERPGGAQPRRLPEDPPEPLQERVPVPTVHEAPPALNAPDPNVLEGVLGVNETPMGIAQACNTADWRDSYNFMDAAFPCSVDTKKKELVGTFDNRGRRWQPMGTPEPVFVHDFPGTGVGKAIPNGTYDVARDEAVVNVGITHETADFAVESIRR